MKGSEMMKYKLYRWRNDCAEVGLSICLTRQYPPKGNHEWGATEFTELGTFSNTTELAELLRKEDPNYFKANALACAEAMLNGKE